MTEDAKLLLTEAAEIIHGERQSSYGNALETHQRIAAIWTVVLGQPVTAEQVCACMIGLKLARLANSINHRDSWLDIAGYVGVYDKMQRGE